MKTLLPSTPTAKFRAELRAAIEDYVEAYVADSWKGGGHPEDIPEFEQELREAKAKLDELVNKARPS